jgi:hypothetical protein
LPKPFLKIPYAVTVPSPIILGNPQVTGRRTFIILVKRHLP